MIGVPLRSLQIRYACYRILFSANDKIVQHIAYYIYMCFRLKYISKPQVFSPNQNHSQLKMSYYSDKVIVVLEHKYLQQLQLLALPLEMLRYIPGLLNRFGYLRKISDF